MDVAVINSIIEKFPGTIGNIIGILNEVQKHFHYLPETELRYISKKTKIPITQLYSVATFYDRFSLKPKGKHNVCVCLGAACHVKGAEKVMNEIKEKLHIDQGKTTDDMKFSLEEVRCVGACNMAPAMMIDEKTYGQVKPKQISKILSQYG